MQFNVGGKCTCVSGACVLFEDDFNRADTTAPAVVGPDWAANDQAEIESNRAHLLANAFDLVYLQAAKKIDPDGGLRLTVDIESEGLDQRFGLIYGGNADNCLFACIRTENSPSDADCAELQIVEYDAGSQTILDSQSIRMLHASGTGADEPKRRRRLHLCVRHEVDTGTGTGTGTHFEFTMEHIPDDDDDRPEEVALLRYEINGGYLSERFGIGHSVGDETGTGNTGSGGYFDNFRAQLADFTPGDKDDRRDYCTPDFNENSSTHFEINDNQIDFSDNFDDRTGAVGNNWTAQLGSWSINGSNELENSDSSEAIITHAHTTADHVVVSAWVKGSLPGKKLRVIAGYSDNDNYWYAEIELGTPGAFRLFEKDGGTSTEHDSVTGTFDVGVWYQVFLCAREGYVSAWVEDLTGTGTGTGTVLWTLEKLEADFTANKSGVGGDGLGTANFDSVEFRTYRECPNCLTCVIGWDNFGDDWTNRSYNIPGGSGSCEWQWDPTAPGSSDYAFEDGYFKAKNADLVLKHNYGKGTQNADNDIAILTWLSHIDPAGPKARIYHGQIAGQSVFTEIEYPVSTGTGTDLDSVIFRIVEIGDAASETILEEEYRTTTDFKRPDEGTNPIRINSYILNDSYIVDFLQGENSLRMTASPTLGHPARRIYAQAGLGAIDLSSGQEIWWDSIRIDAIDYANGDNCFGTLASDLQCTCQSICTVDGVITYFADYYVITVNNSTLTNDECNKCADIDGDYVVSPTEGSGTGTGDCVWEYVEENYCSVCIWDGLDPATETTATADFKIRMSVDPDSCIAQVQFQLVPQNLATGWKVCNTALHLIYFETFQFQLTASGTDCAKEVFTMISLSRHWNGACDGQLPGSITVTPLGT